MKFYLCFLLLFTPIKPMTNTSLTTDPKENVILLYGEDLSMMFLISMKPSHTIAIRTIPMNILIPATCANHHPTALSNIKNEDCIKTSLSAVFPIEIINTVAIHTNQIEQDFILSKSATELKTFSDMQTYFHELGTQISYSIIWNINTYLDSDISLLDLYTYYELYTADDLQIQYYFLHLFQIDAFHMISLDTHFYEFKV